MSAFLVNGNLQTERKSVTCGQTIFKSLVTPSENEHFDNDFLNHVVYGVHEIFASCTNSPFGILCEPLKYDEVACVCSKLKLGVYALFIHTYLLQVLPYGGSCLSE